MKKVVTKAEAFIALRKTKLCVYSKSLSSRIQERLFELGFKWYGGKKGVDTTYPFLFIHDNGDITTSGFLDAYDASPYKEINPTDIIEMVIIDESTPMYKGSPVDILYRVKTTNIECYRVRYTGTMKLHYALASELKNIFYDK